MYKALTSFSGILSMAEGEVRDIADKAVISDLLKAGYIEEVKPPADATKKKTAKKKDGKK